MKEPDNMQQPPDPEDFWEDSDGPEFVPCLLCDGHPACEDFGCAYELGLGRMVKKDPGNDFDW